MSTTTAFGVTVIEVGTDTDTSYVTTHPTPGLQSMAKTNGMVTRPYMSQEDSHSLTTEQPDHIHFAPVAVEWFLFFLIGAVSMIVVLMVITLLRRQYNRWSRHQNKKCFSEPEEIELQERPLPAAPNLYSIDQNELRESALSRTNTSNTRSGERTSAPVATNRDSRSSKVMSEYEAMPDGSEAAKAEAEEQVLYEAVNDGGGLKQKVHKLKRGSMQYEDVDENQEKQEPFEEQVEYEDVNASPIDIGARPASCNSDSTDTETCLGQVDYEEIPKSSADVNCSERARLFSVPEEDATPICYSGASTPPSSSHPRLGRLGRTSFEKLPEPGHQRLPKQDEAKRTSIQQNIYSLQSEPSNTNIDDVVVENTLYVPFECDDSSNGDSTIDVGIEQNPPAEHLTNKSRTHSINIKDDNRGCDPSNGNTVSSDATKTDQNIMCSQNVYVPIEDLKHNKNRSHEKAKTSSTRENSRVFDQEADLSTPTCTEESVPSKGIPLETIDIVDQNRLKDSSSQLHTRRPESNTSLSSPILEPNISNIALEAYRSEYTLTLDDLTTGSASGPLGNLPINSTPRQSWQSNHSGPQPLEHQAKNSKLSRHSVPNSGH